MIKSRYIFLLLFILLFASCTPFSKDIRVINKMEGDWNIATSERWVINQNGAEKFEDFEDAGTVLIEEDPQSISGGTKIMTINYVNVDGNALTGSYFLVLDEAAKRVKWKYILCPGLFECDLLFELEERSVNKMVWTTYFIGGAAIYDPAFMYDPSKAEFNTKWTLTLRK